MVILRALGPSLTALGITGAMTDPTLELHDASGALMATNDNWRDSQESLFAAGGLYEAFQPGSDLEAAIAISLPPGTYSSFVRGKNSATGVAMTEVNDYSQDAGSRLASINGRGRVQTGENVLVGGITLSDAAAKVVIRALGPSLSGNGVSTPLADPLLEIYDGNGTLVSSNDNWRDTPEQATSITAAGLAPSSDAEAAVAVTLIPGSYTAVVSGKNDTTGVASLEVRKLP
jgi:hypothetical protein